MTFWRSIAAAATLLACPLSAHAETDTAAMFGKIAETWDAEISPNGKHLALGCSPQGVPAVCLYELDSDAKPKMIPPPKGAQISGIRWASDNYLLYYVDLFEKIPTVDGLKDVTVHRLLSYSIKTGKTAVLMRNARSVINTTRIDSILLDKPNKIQMAFTFVMDDRKRANSLLSNEGELRYIIYEVDLKNGKAKVMDTMQRSVFDGVHDAKGKRYAEILQDVKKKTFSVVSTIDGRKTIFDRNKVELDPFYVEGIDSDGKHLILNFDDGKRFGLHRMSLIDGAITPYEIDDGVVGDVGLIDDPFTGQVVAYNYTGDLPRRIYTDPAFSEVADGAKQALGADSVILTSWTKDRRLFTVAAMNKGKPTDYYLYDVKAPSLSPVGGTAPWLAEAPLGDVSKVTYQARDGLEIPAYLTLPPGKIKTDGPFPLVLMPHGGPEARDSATYDWLAQAVASEGYMVLQPNFRGSSGYGAKFRNAGYREFGGKMVTDVLDGAAYLKAEGLVAGDGHCSMGWSYGGYSALMTGLLGKDTTQCIISINGVTDPFGMLDSNGQARTYWEQYMGDVHNTRFWNKKEITPVDRANEYTAPVLLLHGKEDTTVPFDQASDLKRRLPKAQVELVRFPGDDHYMQNTASRVQILEESLAFLAAHHPAR